MIEVEAPSEFVCPLTLDVMEDPVMSKYGNSFERSEILEWLKAGHGVCPLSRRPLSLQDLVTNHGLRAKIREWRKENGDDSVVVVTPPAADQVYGFITLPTKDDGTDRTMDEEEEDLFYLQLAALGLGGRPPRVTQQRNRHRQRRASTGSVLNRNNHHHRRRRGRMTRPFRGLRDLILGSSATTNSSSA